MLRTYTLSEQAVVIQVGSGISMDIHQQVMAYKKAIEAANFPWLMELVPAYDSITLYYNIPVISKKAYSKSIATWVLDEIEKLNINATNTDIELKLPIEIPVCYHQSYGTDLNYLSEIHQLSIEDIIELHTSIEYNIYMLGFLPGFPYMGTVHKKIQTPRKKTPALKIAAGSVGIAGEQTGIYPLESPGGWQIIGRTPLQIFDISKENPCLFKQGDFIRFRSITMEEFHSIQKKH